MLFESWMTVHGFVVGHLCWYADNLIEEVGLIESQLLFNLLDSIPLETFQIR